MKVLRFLAAGSLITLWACPSERLQGSCHQQGTFPVNMALVQFISPQGSLRPTKGQALPSSSLFVNLNAPNQNVVAPTDLHLTQIQSTPSVNLLGATDQRLTMQYLDQGCASQSVVIAWTGTLDATLAQAQSSAVGSAVDLDLGEGAPLGTTQTSQVEVAAYDSSQTVPFVNPSRYPVVWGVSALNAVCPLNSFSPSLQSSLGALLGSATALRTVAPLCGTANFDSANHLAGNWFNASGVGTLSFAQDNVNPSLPAMSVGQGVPNLLAGVYTFTPLTADFRNIAFANVVADGIYCYQNITTSSGTTLAGSLLVQLLSATTLQVEYQAGSACAAVRSSLAFTTSTNYVSFAR